MSLKCHVKTLYIAINYRSIHVFLVKIHENQIAWCSFKKKKIFATQIHGKKNQKTVIALSSHNIWVIVWDVNNNFYFVFIKWSDVSAIYFSYIGMCYIFISLFSFWQEKYELVLFIRCLDFTFKCAWWNAGSLWS